MSAPVVTVVAPLAPQPAPSAVVKPAIAAKRAFAAPAWTTSTTAAAPAPAPSTATVKPSPAPRKAAAASAHVLAPVATTPGPPPPPPAAKRAKSAWHFFCDAQRPGLTAAHLGASMGELAKLMGTAWAAEADKAPYEALAAAAKAALSPPTAGGGEKGKKKGAPPAPSAYALFCRDLRATLAAANPGADVGTMSKLLAGAWAGADAGVKAQYEAQAAAGRRAVAKATADAAAAAAAAGGGGAAAAAAPPPASNKRKARSAGGASKAEGDAAFDAEAAARAGGRPSPAQRALEEEEAARLACDWGAHPAEAVLAETERGHYVVKRAGLGFHEYGLVDAAAAKRARLEGGGGPGGGGGAGAPGGGAPAASILPPALIDAFEGASAAFDTALHARCEGNALDLDDLEGGSALECCAFLGALREAGYPLAARAAGVRARADRPITLPMLGLSRLVQRAVDVERAGRAAAEAEVARLQAKLAVGGAGGGRAAAGTAGEE